MKRKRRLRLAGLASIGIPVATVVSCGNSKSYEKERIYNKEVKILKDNLVNFWPQNLQYYNLKKSDDFNCVRNEFKSQIWNKEWDSLFFYWRQTGSLWEINTKMNFKFKLTKNKDNVNNVFYVVDLLESNFLEKDKIIKNIKNHIYVYPLNSNLKERIQDYLKKTIEWSTPVHLNYKIASLEDLDKRKADLLKNLRNNLFKINKEKIINAFEEYLIKMMEDFKSYTNIQKEILKKYIERKITNFTKVKFRY